MTVAVAIRKANRTVIAADSLVNFGGQRFDANNCQFHKIRRIGDSMMAWAGWSIYSEILTAHLASQNPPTFETEDKVFLFFMKLWKALRDDYTILRNVTGNHPFADLDSTFLLVNKGGIFRVSSDMDVTRFDRYSAIGSGSKYALGALSVLYDTVDDPRALAERSVQIGIDFDVYCGGPIDIEEVVS